MENVAWACIVQIVRKNNQSHNRRKDCRTTGLKLFFIIMSEILEMALKLPVADRIRLADELYMSVADLPGTTPLTDAQIEELERRLEEHRLNPEASVPLK